MASGRIPVDIPGMIVDLFDDVQHQCEQGHPHQHAVVRLAKDSKVGIIVEVIIEFPGVVPPGMRSSAGETRTTCSPSNSASNLHRECTVRP